MNKAANEFELLLFATDPGVIRYASQAGIHGFIIDMENKGKQSRQAGFDTQINENTIKDLENARQSTNRKVICRINSFGDHTQSEIEQVIAAGADEILLPMVQSPSEVWKVLKHINKRCMLGILIETMDAVRASEELATIPLSRVYVGLNDLAINRNLSNIFISIADGTVENIRKHFTQPFGFGGLTLPERGEPIPCRLLMGELMRLRCNFTFLRRSFYRDIAGRDMQVEVPRIMESIRISARRSQNQIEQDQREFEQCLLGIANSGFIR
jgi:hypothetical protein